MFNLFKTKINDKLKSLSPLNIIEKDKLKDVIVSSVNPVITIEMADEKHKSLYKERKSLNNKTGYEIIYTSESSLIISQYLSADKSELEKMQEFFLREQFQIDWLKSNMIDASIVNIEGIINQKEIINSVTYDKMMFKIDLEFDNRRFIELSTIGSVDLTLNNEPLKI